MLIDTNLEDFKLRFAQINDVSLVLEFIGVIYCKI